MRANLALGGAAVALQGRADDFAETRDVAAAHPDVLEVAATAHGLSEEEGGGYLWRGELRLWDNALLMGWYSAVDGGVRSKGTMYFILSAHGLPALGRWVGLSYDGKIVTGWAVIAKTEDQVPDLIRSLKDSNGTGPPL